MDKKIVDAIKSTKTVSELKDLAVKNGYNITDEQTNKYFDLFHGSTNLNDNELDKMLEEQVIIAEPIILFLIRDIVLMRHII